MTDYSDIENYPTDEPAVITFVVKDPDTGCWGIFMEVAGQRLIACDEAFDTLEEAQETIDRVMAGANRMLRDLGVNARLITDRLADPEMN